MRTPVLVAYMATVAMMLGLSVSSHAENIKGNGKIETKDIPIEVFSKVEIKSLDCKGVSKSNLPVFTYTQGASTSLSVTTDENLFDYLEFSTNKGELQVKTKKGCSISPTRLEMNGESNALEKAVLGKGISLRVASELQGDKLELEVKDGPGLSLPQAVKVKNCSFSIDGGGSLEVKQIQADKLNVDLKGGGNALLTGQVKTGNIRVRGGGDLTASGLQTEEMKCGVQDGGDAKVSASKKLQIEVKDGGELYYKGKPSSLEISLQGGGDLHKLE